MAMNVAHRLLCRSTFWRRVCEKTVLPWTLDDVSLGEAALEIGPGYGANIPTLQRRSGALTVAEIDPDLAERLRDRVDGDVDVVCADGARLPMDDETFTAVSCFTMLHHVPTARAQDALFEQAHRVLRPGGVFVGSDGLDSPGMRLLHIGDTFNPVSADSLGDRLRTAGFRDVEIQTKSGRIRFRAGRSA